MKKLVAGGLFASMVVTVSVAMAFSPTLKNEDSRSYDYDLECGGSTTHSSIGGNTSTTLSSGCTLKVDGAGSASLSDGTSCVIKDGSLSCN
ncbi:MAG: hypothetical protein U0271_45975 [Polyangiaceae bacterium]